MNEFQVKVTYSLDVLPRKRQKDRRPDLSGSDLTDVCANVLFSRGAKWDEPPCSYFVYKRQAGLVLRDIGMPDHVMRYFGGLPGEYLRALAKSVYKGAIAPSPAPGEKTAGFVFFSEAWQLIKQAGSREELGKILDEGHERRIHLHPDRAEIRMAVGCLLGEQPWIYSLERGRELVSAMAARATPGRPLVVELDSAASESSPEGAVPDGVFLVCKALQGERRDDGPGKAEGAESAPDDAV